MNSPPSIDPSAYLSADQIDCLEIKQSYLALKMKIKDIENV